MKNDKRKNVEGKEQQKQEKIWTLGEKENYKYLGILEVDIIKQVKMKEKYETKASEKRESLPKPNSAAGISSKE